MRTQHITQKSKHPLTSLLLGFLLVWTATTAGAQNKRLSASEYRVLEVAPITGDDYASGTALLEANQAAATSDQRWLLLLSPGTYDLGARNLEMDENVSIQGAGMESTYIVGNGTTELNLGEGVIEGADNVRLSELTVVCTNDTSSELCITMANVDASPRIHRVRFQVEGPGLHWGVRNTNSSPIIEEVEIYLWGGTHNYGIVNAEDSFPEIQRSIVTAENGNEQNVAIFDKAGGLTIRVDDSELYAVGGTHAIGLYNDGEVTDGALLDDVSIEVNGGSAVTGGIYGGNYSLHLQGSSLVAVGAQAIAAELDGNGSLLVTDSELLADGTCALAGQIQLGSTRVGPGTVAGTTQTCTGVYRLGSSPEFFTNTCPGGAAFASKSRIRIYEMGD